MGIKKRVEFRLFFLLLYQCFDGLLLIQWHKVDRRNMDGGKRSIFLRRFHSDSCSRTGYHDLCRECRIVNCHRKRQLLVGYATGNTFPLNQHTMVVGVKW